jgi:hypothetical protein
MPLSVSLLACGLCARPEVSVLARATFHDRLADHFILSRIAGRDPPKQRVIVEFAPEFRERPLNSGDDRVGNPDTLQFAGPQQSRQGDRIAPVRLDALARPLGDQRGATTSQR